MAELPKFDLNQAAGDPKITIVAHPDDWHYFKRAVLQHGFFTNAGALFFQRLHAACLAANAIAEEFTPEFKDRNSRVAEVLLRLNFNPPPVGASPEPKPKSTRPVPKKEK